MHSTNGDVGDFFLWASTHLSVCVCVCVCVCVHVGGCTLRSGAWYAAIARVVNKEHTSKGLVVSFGLQRRGVMKHCGASSEEEEEDEEVDEGEEKGVELCAQPIDPLRQLITLFSQSALTEGRCVSLCVCVCVRVCLA